jgi:radical SAM protein with 4Fe4S-binding SPASM domain
VNIASVLADGSISACPNLRSNFIQGNIYKDDFMTVWNERFKPHRDRSWTKTGICGDCNLFRYCEGNSLHLRTEKNELLMCHMKKLQPG